MPFTVNWILTILGTSLVGDTLGWTYHYSTQKMNWTQARMWCQTHYTDMVAFQNQEENDYLVSVLPNRTSSPYYWIGISKTEDKGPWTWIGNNGTWVGNQSWALNEPNNSHRTEFCVEIYMNHGINRGRWNDEKCSFLKYPVCYQAQCNLTSCNGHGKCVEVINGTQCEYEAGFHGHEDQTGQKCCLLSEPNDGLINCSGADKTTPASCQFSCSAGFLLLGSRKVTCSANGHWDGPRPVCANFKHILLSMAGGGILFNSCCLWYCCLKQRTRNKNALPRTPEEGATPSSEPSGSP